MISNWFSVNYCNFNGVRVNDQPNEKIKVTKIQDKLQTTSVYQLKGSRKRPRNALHGKSLWLLASAPMVTIWWLRSIMHSADADVVQGDVLAPSLFIIVIDYVIKFGFIRLHAPIILKRSYTAIILKNELKYLDKFRKWNRDQSIHLVYDDIIPQITSSPPNCSI